MSLVRHHRKSGCSDEGAKRDRCAIGDSNEGEHRTRWWLRLHEKVASPRGAPPPCLEEYLNGWISAAGIERDKKGPLFYIMGKGDRLGERAMS